MSQEERAGSYDLLSAGGREIARRSQDLVVRGLADLQSARGVSERPSSSSPFERGTIANLIGMKAVLIPAGEFMMGSPDGDWGAFVAEKPRHRVRITQPFYLGATAVTHGQYRAVIGENPSGFDGSDDLPVEQVSWNDAIAFCNKLSEKNGLPLFYRVEGGVVTVPDGRGSGYRLPTEAEWEYACRAGSASRYSFGDDESSLGDYAWFDGNSDMMTHPVAQKRANAWGLFDMHGNVWEWCWDGFDPNYYRGSPGVDPLGPSGAAPRVLRGGSWYNIPRFARSAFRHRYGPDFRSFNLGLRIARGHSGH